MEYKELKNKIMSLPVEHIEMSYRGFELDEYINHFMQKYQSFRLEVRYFDNGEDVELGYIASVETLELSDTAEDVTVVKTITSKPRSTKQDACIDLVATLGEGEGFIS